VSEKKNKCDKGDQCEEIYKESEREKICE